MPSEKAVNQVDSEIRRKGYIHEELQVLVCHRFPGFIRRRMSCQGGGAFKGHRGGNQQVGSASL